MDPCKDDIYNGEHPQIEKHGEEDHYAVRAQTENRKKNKLVLYIWDAEGKRMQCEL